MLIINKPVWVFHDVKNYAILSWDHKKRLRFKSSKVTLLLRTLYMLKTNI